MSEMVERAARAICRAQGDDPDAQARDGCDPRNDAKLRWECCVDEAQAAITAMREPTDAMILHAYGYMDAPRGGAGEMAVDLWQTQIDQALKP